MKNLNEIPKKNLFQVPEGYFDRLPMIIAERVATPPPRPSFLEQFAPALKLALPAAVIILAVALFLKPGTPSPEQIVASVDTNELIAYLEDTDVSTDDLLESVDLDESDADLIQDQSILELTDSPNSINWLENEYDLTSEDSL